MNPGLEWINRAAENWWQYVAQVGWQAALVGLLLVLVVRCAGDRWPAPLRYALLVLALLKFACPPLLPVSAGILHELGLPRIALLTRAERKPARAPAPGVHEASMISGPGRFAWLNALAAVVKGRTPAALTAFSWTTWFMLVHAGGVALVARSVHREASRLRDLTRHPVRRLNPELGDGYRNLAIQLGVYRIPAVTVSDRAEAPMAFGFHHPFILLPTRIVSGLSPAELKAVLAHELAHCQRGDLWLVWVQVVLFALWWFHPVLWLVNRQLNNTREDCCDDLVLGRGVISNDAYCDLLLRAASATVTPPAALAFGQPLHPLGRRMARITDWTLARCERIPRAGAVGVACAALVLLPGVKLTPVANHAGPGSALASASMGPAPQRHESGLSSAALACRRGAGPIASATKPCAAPLAASPAVVAVPRVTTPGTPPAPSPAVAQRIPAALTGPRHDTRVSIPVVLNAGWPVYVRPCYGGGGRAIAPWRPLNRFMPPPSTGPNPRAMAGGAVPFWSSRSTVGNGQGVLRRGGL
jgi:beta-lactamase regulating signal transducer with metallopeptidase domain